MIIINIIIIIIDTNNVTIIIIIIIIILIIISNSSSTPNLPTNIVDFRGFDSSIILILRGGIPRPIGIS